MNSMRALPGSNRIHGISKQIWGIALGDEKTFKFYNVKAFIFVSFWKCKNILTKATCLYVDKFYVLKGFSRINFYQSILFYFSK